MDPILREKIIIELRNLLNREPSEKEIINAQTDINIMGNIRAKDQELIKEQLAKLGINI